MNKAISILAAIIVVLSCFYYPLNGIFLFFVLGLYSLLLWFYPLIWLFVVPASLPLLDLSPVTGLLFFNEFDLIVLTTVLIFNLRRTNKQKKIPFPQGLKFMIVLLTISYGVSMLIGIFPMELPNGNSLTNYYSRYVSLRSVKGYIEAVMLIPMIRNDIGNNSNIKKYLISGLLTGFGGVTVFVLYERQLFSGLFNFSNDYRITGTFFEMNTGGAFIDGYLSMMLPVVFLCFFWWRGFVSKMIGMVLFVAGLYALLVTFSRICYASFITSMIPLVTGIIFFYKKKWKAVMFASIIILVTGAITIPVLRGGYIKDRFAKLSQGMETRSDHWKDAIQKMDTTSSATLFGMGPGTYPKTYSQKSDKKKPGFYQFADQEGNQFLRLFPGEPLYFGQRISLKSNTAYELTFHARSSAKGRLTFPICEKSILHSYNCNWKSIAIGNKKNSWQGYKVMYPGFAIGQGRIYQKRPIEFSIYNSKRDVVIDVDNISFSDSDGNNIIKNGDFKKGSDFWFFTADNHLPWHIKNIFISHFFELGITGLMIFIIFLLFVFIHLIKGVLKKDMFSLILFSSFCGFLVVGLVGSLFDSPRIMFLFYFMSFVSLFYSNVHNTRILTT